MTSPATIARAAAVHCEVKKHAYRQTQDGFVISFILHPQEVPEELATAGLGTRYVMALSQIGDNEMPVELRNLPATGRNPGDSGSDQGKQAGTADDRDSHGRHGPHPKTPPRLESNASAGIGDDMPASPQHGVTAAATSRPVQPTAVPAGDEMPVENTDGNARLPANSSDPDRGVRVNRTRAQVTTSLAGTAIASAGDELEIPPELDRRKKSPAQIAGYLCTLPAFHLFLEERFGDVWKTATNFLSNYQGRQMMTTDSMISAEVVRRLCVVNSRADLTDKNTEWHALQLAFKLWQNHPELEDA